MSRGVASVLALVLWTTGICAAASSGLAAPEPLGPPIDELRALDITATTRPSDDAVILYRGVRITCDPDGRVTRRFRQVQRLLTDLSIDQRGDPRVAYDTTRQVLSIDVCRTFMLDGKEVPSTAHAFNRVTPERVASCADRCGLQEMVVSFLGLERGCLTELDYTLRDRLPWRPWCEGIEDLGDPAPVLKGEVQIHGDSLRAEVVTNVTLPNLAGSERAGTWRYGPLPGYLDEGGATPRERIPYLLYSTCPTWQDLLQWIGGRLDRAAQPDSAIVRWAAAPLEKGRHPINEEEKWSRVSRLVSARTSAAEDSPLSWWLPVRPAARTFETSCGNVLDRAALAWAALRAYGVTPQAPGLVYAARGEPRVPAISQFDDILFHGQDVRVALSIARGTISPAEAAPKWGVVGVDARTVLLGGGCGGWNETDVSVRIHENDDGSVRGEAAVRIRRDCPGSDLEDVKGFLAGLAAGYVKGGALAGFTVQEMFKTGLRATFSFTGTSLGDSLGGGRLKVSIPSDRDMSDLLFPERLSLRRRTRTIPIVYPMMSARENVHLRLELSSRSRAVVLPESGRYESKGAVLETHVTREEGAIVIDRRLSLSAQPVHRIDPDAYPDFRAVLLRRVAPARNAVVVEPRGEVGTR